VKKLSEVEALGPEGLLVAFVLRVDPEEEHLELSARNFGLPSLEVITKELRAPANACGSGFATNLEDAVPFHIGQAGWTYTAPSSRGERTIPASNLFW
jgi:hypothetical protein